MGYILVFNSGSSSLKFSLLNSKDFTEKVSGIIERIKQPEAKINFKLENGDKEEKLIPNTDFEEAVQEIYSKLVKLKLNDKIIGIGHRVVHGGEKFKNAVIVNKEVLSTIENLARLAPLHNFANALVIKAIQKLFPNLKNIAVFDTAFHQDMPKKAYLYAIPYELYEKYGIRRYGFHGTSHKYIANKAAKFLDQPIEKLNLVTVHLGNGSSITAVKHGKSLDTSMGLSPDEGVIMGTRSGDLGPTLPEFIAKTLKIDNNELNELINKKSGLLGISGISNDMRVLENESYKNNERAILARDMFCYKVARKIAAYIVPLGTIDAIVFAGGIGENDAKIREYIINYINGLGFKIDVNKNINIVKGKEGNIAMNDSKSILVIPTNEEIAIAKDVLQLI